MFIDIIMPFKNEEKYIKKAINSLLYSKIIGQIILVDDHSTDRSWDICTELMYENLDKIILIKNLGIGKVSAINTGFKNVNNSFLWLVDADDYIKVKPDFNLDYLNENKILDIDIFFIDDTQRKKLMIKRRLDINNYDNYISDLVIFPKASFIIPKKIYKFMFPIDELCPFEDIWISYNIWIKKYPVIKNNLISYMYRQHQHNTFGNARNYSKDLVRFRYGRILKGLEILNNNFTQTNKQHLIQQAQFNAKFVLGYIGIKKFLRLKFLNKLRLSLLMRFLLLRYFPKLIEIYKKFI